ncbi:MAG: 2-isopropylmalate synthase [Anaerolineales bacterium]|nr:2-isopropylmalate synthase [Anaerolineales bacterium]
MFPPSTVAAVSKYQSPAPVLLPDRQWPSRSLTHSPLWASVDLRDGNQALPNPLNPHQKLEYFELLCRIGFKNIEVAFPSASQDDFDFTHRLIREDRIPDDVFIMVLTQCRQHLIARTFESIQGVRQAIFHCYIATSDLHIRQVFDFDRRAVLDQVVGAVTQIRQGAEAMPDSDIRLEFSPEEFTDSDPSFVLELCEAVYRTWSRATSEKPLILNLPATVERRPPNHYADMVEWFCRSFSHPEDVIVSLHSHNDQGMAVAATELALLAGAQRVEGTLFGHGERTGNVDLVTVANNLYSRGIATGLDFSNLPEIAGTVERLTGMPVYYRAPYAGEYVFTAFSGSHQDAIRKGMNRLNEAPEKFGVGWKVPYLHVDPTDLGRRYESLIRINSQSGKGGIVWILEREYGLQPPRPMHPEIGAAVQEYADELGREINASEVYGIFQSTFVNPQGPYRLNGYWPRPDEQDPTLIHGELRLSIEGCEQSITADGNGPVSAFMNGLRLLGISDFSVDDYHEQALGKGADAIAVAYVPLKFEANGVLYGVGTGTNINQAAVNAIVAALNRWSSAHQR